MEESAWPAINVSTEKGPVMDTATAALRKDLRVMMCLLSWLVFCFNICSGHAEGDCGNHVFM